MTTETLILLYFIACLTLGVGCVTLFFLWLAEGREVEDLRKSKEELRDSLTKHNYYLRQQLDRMAAEIYNLRTQNHQKLRSECNEKN